MTYNLPLISISSRSILILSSHLRLGLPKELLPVNLPVKILKALLPSYVPCPFQSSRFNPPDYIRWTVQTMKFLIVEPSPLPILIPLGPKYSPRDPVFKSCTVWNLFSHRFTRKAPILVKKTNNGCGIVTLQRLDCSCALVWIWGELSAGSSWPS